MGFVGEHPVFGVTGAFAFLSADLFNLGAARRHKSRLPFLYLVEQQPSRDEAVESLLACGLAFNLQSARPMEQHYAGGRLVDVLAAVSAGAHKSFLDVGLAHAECGHAPRQLGFLFRADRESTHILADGRELIVESQ